MLKKQKAKGKASKLGEKSMVDMVGYKSTPYIEKIECD